MAAPIDVPAPRSRAGTATPVDPAPRRWWITLVAIAGVGLLARVVYVLTIGSDVELGADATWYSLQASLIGDGQGYLDPASYFVDHRAVATAAFPPLWPTLASSLEVVGSPSHTSFQLLGAVVGTSTVVLTGMLGRAVAGGSAGLIAAAIVACSPALVAADGSLMADGLAVALLVATALLAARAADEPGVLRFAATGLVGGLAVLTRSDAIVVVGLLVVVAIWSARGDLGGRARVKVAVAAVGAIVVVLVPWSVRSSVRFEQPVVLSTNIGSLVEAANCPSTYRGSLLGMWDRECLHETNRRGVSEPDRSEAAVRRGFAHVRAEPERVPLVVAARVARGFGLWNPWSNARLEVAETRDEGWQIAAWAYGLVTLLLAIPGLVWLSRRDLRRTAPVLVLVGGSVIVLALSWGNPRFRLSAEPALAIGAAATLMALGARMRAGTPTDA